MTNYPNGFDTPGPPEPRAASKAGYVKGVTYDQYDRYILPGDPEPWTHVTTISGFGTNTEGLRVWTERGIMRGLGEWPAGRRTLAANPADQAVHDQLLKEAKLRAGLHDAAAEGTALHKELQTWAELGHDYPGPPPELADDVHAAVGKLQERELSVVKVEALVAHPALRVAGRLDCLWHDESKRAAGTLPRVGDWKSGKDVLNPSKRATFARQLAAYANAEQMLDPVTGELVPMPEVDREYAWLMHVRNGSATLYRVPIAQAWLEFKAACILHHGASAGGAPTFEPEGRTFDASRDLDDAAPLAPMPVTSPADWTEQVWHDVVSAGLRCPSCDQLTAEVSPKGDWNCESCQVYGAAYDEIMSAKESGGDDGSSAELDVSPSDARLRLAAQTCAHGQWSRREDASWVCGACGAPGAGSAGNSELMQVITAGIEPHRPGDVDQGGYCNTMVMRDGFGDACGLPIDHPVHVRGPIGDPASAEIAKADVLAAGLPPDIAEENSPSLLGLAPLAGPGQRGCGVCGRTGHRRGSDKCLGDADPAKMQKIVERQAIEMLERQGAPDDVIAEALATPSYPDQVDFCDGHCDPKAGLDRDEHGRWRCVACGKPATVAAIRARVTGQAAEPATPVAPVAAADETPPWLPTPDELAPLAWPERLRSASDASALGELAKQVMSEDPEWWKRELSAIATARWQELNMAGKG